MVSTALNLVSQRVAQDNHSLPVKQIIVTQRALVTARLLISHANLLELPSEVMLRPKLDHDESRGRIINDALHAWAYSTAHVASAILDKVQLGLGR